MIRIIDTENKKPVAFPKEQKAIFKLLGIVVADNPSSLKHLLRKYGVSISSNTTNLELTVAVVNAIEVGDENFNQDLAEIFEEQVIPDDYDSFNHNDLFENEATSYDNFSIKEPFSKLFKSVGKLLRGNKKAKTQAKGETIKSTMEFQVKKDQRSEKEKSASKKSKIIKIAAATTIATAVIGFIIWKVKKGKTSPIKLT